MSDDFDNDERTRTQAAKDAAARAGAKMSGAYEGAKDAVDHGYHAARDAVSHGYETTREAIAHGYDRTREKTTHAYDAARERASAARHGAADGLEQNPLAALAGGLAVGALLGALLPKTQREARLIGPLGRQVTERATAAAAAARQAGTEKLDELGLNKTTAKEKAATLVDAAKQVAGSAGSAAKDTVKSGSTAPASGGTSMPGSDAGATRTDF